LRSLATRAGKAALDAGASLLAAAMAETDVAHKKAAAETVIRKPGRPVETNY
jgi:hypothetical protein